MMSPSTDLRASDRIAIGNRVQLMPIGRMAFYALTINLSMGGVLLKADPPLPVGSPCGLAILISEGKGEQRVITEGTVVRSDARGTAIRFSNALEKNTFDAFVRHSNPGIGNSIINAYLTYFKVAQSESDTACEKLLGISKRHYRTVFLTTFFSSILLAILPVWLFSSNIPAFPNWVKISASFIYGAFWLGIIQPAVDLMVFRAIRNRQKIN